AAYRLGQKALDNRPMRFLFCICLVLVLLGSVPFMAIFGVSPIAVPELLLLLGAGAAYILWLNRAKLIPAAPLASFALLSGHGLLEQSPTLPGLFWQFFLIGSTLFGSGYVLAAYLQRTFVKVCTGSHLSNCWTSSQSGKRRLARFRARLRRQ